MTTVRYHGEAEIEVDAGDGEHVNIWTIEADYHPGRRSHDPWQPDDGPEFDIESAKLQVVNADGVIVSTQAVSIHEVPDSIEAAAVDQIAAQYEADWDEHYHGDYDSRWGL